MSDTTSTNVISVSKALTHMKLTDDIKAFIISNQENWKSFGKKDSSLLREQLMSLFAKEKMSGESIFMVYFFHSVVKSSVRISRSLEGLPEDIRKKTWFAEVKSFMDKRMVQYTSQETIDKFASVHLPSTNPGLDCYCAALQEKKPSTKKELEDSVSRIIGRSTFTQLRINTELQNENKAAVMNFWKNTVKQSKVKQMRKARNTNVDEEGFQEAYYDTSASDAYYLIGEGLQEVAPTDGKLYTRIDIISWFLHTLNVSKEEGERLLQGTALSLEEIEKRRLAEEKKLADDKKAAASQKLADLEKQMLDYNQEIQDPDTTNRRRDELKPLMEDLDKSINNAKKEYERLR